MVKDKMVDVFTPKIEDIKINKNEKWAIYGTGQGSELIIEVFSKMQMLHSLHYIIDRDDKIDSEEFHGIPLKKLSEICGLLRGIIIAAPYSSQIIRERIQESLTKEQLKKIRVIDIFAYNTNVEKLKYAEYIEQGILKRDKEFISFDEQEYQRKSKDTKVIAWYLPQFHQMEINNRFHGQGFTEWTNTSRAIPLFVGHYQPHIPYDVGYYDLTNLESLKRQIYLAKHYGIYGFCIHYYWFSGVKLMEKPLELLLKHKELDIPFCLDWATENWTALWDGRNREIMLEQKLNDGDEQHFMEDILPYMMDSRYIKIDGKPVLVIYRINMFEKTRVKRLLHNFRIYAQKSGFPDLYIMLSNSLGLRDDVTEWGADALVEYQPQAVWNMMEKYRPEGYLNPYFRGSIFDSLPVIEEEKYMVEYNNKKFFRSALTSWDNTARKAVSGAWILQGLNPKTFKKWLKDIVIESKKIHSAEEDIVFVNSWNEWAEGSHLEPDMKYGYGYLQAVKDVLEEV